MELDMVADKEVDKVADMVAGHGCWLIGPKLFRPEPYPPTCVSSKLCECIYTFVFVLFLKLNPLLLLAHLADLYSYASYTFSITIYNNGRSGVSRVYLYLFFVFVCLCLCICTFILLLFVSWFLC